ncbi:response regulator, partial [Candidatus Sumerlaeota bacterium]|nr:response regulator [Candidatus Sumerlaeota bacterium]
RPDLTKRLKTIAASARRGGDLAHQLLAFARGGKTQPIPMNLRETVEEALQLQHRVVPPDVEIELNIAPDLWSIHADPAQMTQVAMNLVINAIEAITGPGKITISAENMALENEFVQLRPALKPGPHVRLTVEDTGCGMSEEVRSRAFEPFFTTKFQGRGLGLAAIYGIVQSHSGHIEVESEPGRGSTFRVYLPALPSTPVPSASLTQAAPAPRGTETLLVVDDDETVLEVSQLMLQKLGYQVLTARSGIEAVEMLRARQSRTDLAIIDLNMPGMNGRETCRVLKKEYPELKVLFCTGDPDDSFAGGLEADRADGYILKPIRMDALAQEIRNTLEGAARA